MVKKVSAKPVKKKASKKKASNKNSSVTPLAQAIEEAYTYPVPAYVNWWDRLKMWVKSIFG